jgi:hypothetical protein
MAYIVSFNQAPDSSESADDTWMIKNAGAWDMYECMLENKLA